MFWCGTFRRSAMSALSEEFNAFLSKAKELVARHQMLEVLVGEMLQALSTAGPGGWKDDNQLDAWKQTFRRATEAGSPPGPV
jgi:hypothetical protein